MHLFSRTKGTFVHSDGITLSDTLNNSVVNRCFLYIYRCDNSCTNMKLCMSQFNLYYNNKGYIWRIANAWRR